MIIIKDKRSNLLLCPHLTHSVVSWPNPCTPSTGCAMASRTTPVPATLPCYFPHSLPFSSWVMEQRSSRASREWRSSTSNSGRPIDTSCHTGWLITAINSHRSNSEHEGKREVEGSVEHLKWRLARKFPSFRESAKSREFQSPLPSDIKRRKETRDAITELDSSYI